jgi:hypothetical protein
MIVIRVNVRPRFDYIDIISPESERYLFYYISKYACIISGRTWLKLKMSRRKIDIIIIMPNKKIYLHPGSFCALI